MKNIKLEKLEFGYDVYHQKNGVFLGSFDALEDGFYCFFADNSRNGYWPAYILREIADELDSLNKEHEEDINKFFDKLKENGN